MKIQKYDGRTREDILQQIAQKAECYVPEWKFDPTHPDAGTALALIFTDLFSETVKRYDRIPEKLRREFFARQNIKMLPALPAEGYAVFSLSSHEFGGTMVPEGTVLTGPHGGKEENTVYETTETFFVTPAKLSHLIYIDGRQDYIEKKDPDHPFFPFSPETKTDREHVLYLCQNDVLHISGTARIRLTLKTGGTGPHREKNDWMNDSGAFRISYGTKDGFIEFQNHGFVQETLLLSLAFGQPEPEKTTLFGKNGYWICCRCLHPWNREPLFVQDIRLSSERNDIRPDVITNNTGEQPDTGFLPFGEYPALFGECYFASEEALGKPGAQIRLTFLLDYEKVPLDNSIPVERKWKILMKRADFTPDPQYDITIEQVVWEYYNGNGWSRLPVKEQNQYLFNGSCVKAGEEVNLTFFCPADAALLTWQSAPTRYIRTRILRMNNLFRPKGTYITPVLHNVRFHYSYPSEERQPDFAMACNHGEHSPAPAYLFQKPLSKTARGAWNVFSGRPEKENTLYLGFDRPLSQGPVSLFCAVAPGLSGTRARRPVLTFAYRRRDRFEPLSVIDQTDGLQKSGCLTFPGKEDFAPYPICGETAYWIRMTLKSDLPETDTHFSPKIQGLYLNTGKILAAEHRPPEFFEIRAGEKNKVCRLLRENIYDLTVRVNEAATLSPSEREMLRTEGRLTEVADTDGEVTERWVEWEETTDFSRSGAADRHYVLDKNRGIVTFPDGIHGFIPPSGINATIRIEYRCLSSLGGNLPARTALTPGSSSGYISRVTAPFPLCGGCRRETADAAMHRCSETLRHMGRAVTAADYELLAREASRSIQSVKCLSGYTPDGNYEPGYITLIVLPKDLHTDSICFERLREKIMDYLSCRMDGNIDAAKRLFIAAPQFLKIDCFARVISRGDDLMKTQKDAAQCLERFLHPVTGNYHGKGWEIGLLPNEAQIRNALKRVAGIRYIRELRVSVSFDAPSGRVEIDPFSRDRKNISREYMAEAAVALSGKHTITASSVYADSRL